MSGLSGLATDERLALLRLARASVEARVIGGLAPALPSGLPRLKERQGAFVTLFLDDTLHGCIGIVEPIHSLAETVAHCAAAAATDDPRFPPLRAIEIPPLTIEITALAPPVVVTDIEVIVLGRHGLMADSEYGRGVLLPQVAVEQGWDVETFVRETLRKAGLPPDAFRTGLATILAFDAEIVSERSTGSTGSEPGSRPRSPGATG